MIELAIVVGCSLMVGFAFGWLVRVLVGEMADRHRRYSGLLPDSTYRQFVEKALERPDEFEWMDV